MNRKITFRGMDRSQVIEDHINKQLDKFNTFLDSENSPVSVALVLEAEREGHHYKVEIRLKSPNYDLVSHAPAHASVESDACQDVYAAINMAVDKMDHELRKAHRKMVDEKKSGGRN